MSTQPEALRLADALSDYESRTVIDVAEAAAELRRLHSLNQELLAALNEVYTTCDWYGDDGKEAMIKARAVIAKAEGEQK